MTRLIEYQTFRMLAGARTALALIAAAGMLLIVPGPADAQESDASLRGNVIVPAGTVTEGMRVVAASSNSGFRREVTVRADGSYNFPSLRTGPYRIELLNADGSVAGAQEITLRVGQDAQLALVRDSDEGVMEEVVVFGREIRTLEGAEIGLNITPEQIDSLPQNSRNFLAFADLAPGVTFERGSNGATRIQGGAQDSRSVNVFIDGVGQKDYVLKNGITGQDSSQGNPFPQSAIGEYRVITQNYKAEFDQVSSAAITAVTQSGTNEFHGDIFWDFTDEGLRAKTPREIELNDDKVETTDNQFGVSFGGPIIRDRLHFFLAYEGKRNEVPVDVSPGAGVDPADLPAQYQALIGNFNRDFEQDLFFGKLDFFPSDVDLFQFSVKVREEAGLRWDGGVNTRSFTHPINNDETRVLLRYERNGGDWINDVRLTFEDSAWNPQPDREIALFLNNSGNQRILNVGGHPNFQNKGQEGWGIQNDFTWIGFDDHEIKAGVKLKWVDLNTEQQQPFNPQYLFNTEFDPDGMTTFNDQVPYRVIIGTPLPGIGDGSATSDNFQFGVYIQDDWQATDRLQLSLGIRWDYEETPVWLDYVTPPDVVSALSGWSGAQLANYNLNEFISDGGNRDTFDGAIAPRLGFSYDLTDIYTLFGGYGRSYDRNQFDFIRAESSAQTFRTFTFNFDTGDPDNPCAGCPVWDPIYLTEQRDMLARQLMQNVGSPSVASTSPELLTGGRAVELDQQLLPLIVRERVLSQTYGPGMAELQAVRASIQSILAFYAERGIRVPTEAEGYVAQRPTGRQVNYASVMKTALEQQLVAIDANLQHLDDQYDQARVNARDFQKFHQKDEELNAELLRLSDLLKTAENSVTELSVKGDETYRLEQISPVRSELSTKRIIKFFGAGTIFGVLCALALAYFREFRDTSLKSVEDVRARINYPVLGGVPLSTASASGSHAADEHRGLAPDLVYLHQPGSAAAEAYRAVRTALFSAAATTGKRKFMVTSAEPGDGKSTFIANLAVAVAQAGKSVLLIDADMRKPRQQGLFSLRHQVGTADVLGGEVEVENAIQVSSVDGLSILAAGGAPYNPAELLSSPRLSDVLNRVGQDYDFVLVDTPPLLTVSDPCIVAPHLDSALLVVRLGKNKSAAINRANELIATHGIDILGTVANGIPMPEVDDYYTARPAAPSRTSQPVEREYVAS